MVQFRQPQNPQGQHPAGTEPRFEVGPVVGLKPTGLSAVLHGALIAFVLGGTATHRQPPDAVTVAWRELFQPEALPPVKEPQTHHDEFVMEMTRAAPILREPEPQPFARFEVPAAKPPRPDPTPRCSELLETRWADLVVVPHVTTPPSDAEAETEDELPPAVVEARPLPSCNLPPSYPQSALRKGIQGTVVVELAIGTDGSVVDAKVVTSSGSPILDEAARRQLATWRFEPAKRDGVATPSTFRQPIVFRITG